MPGTATPAFAKKLEARRQELVQQAESWLMSLPNGTLTRAQELEYHRYLGDIRGISEHIKETRENIDRMGSHPLGKLRGSINSAGRLSPLHCPTEELRRLHTAAQRGQQAAYERRFTSADSLLPPDLYPFPIAAQHENRLLDKLPGYAIDLPSVEFVRHISTTGTAASVAEGSLKPEITLNVDKLVATAAKLSGHLALSTEIRDDWDAFSQYATTELFKIIIDEENRQLLSGDGTGTDMTGFYGTSGILTHDCTADTGTNETPLDSIEKSIAELRSGSALAEPSIAVFHPEDWSHLGRLKNTLGNFLLAPDPSQDETDSLWGIDVLVTTQNPLGTALLIDTTKFGQVAIRSPLGLLVGFANDDLIRNLWRYVGEERLVLTVTRPAAVLAVTNLPTPTVTTAETETRSTKRSTTK